MGLTDLKWWVVALCTGREGGPTSRLLTLPTMLPGPAYLPCLHHARCCQSFAGAVHRMESGIAVPVIVKCGVRTVPAQQASGDWHAPGLLCCGRLMRSGHDGGQLRQQRRHGCHSCKQQHCESGSPG